MRCNSGLEDDRRSEVYIDSGGIKVSTFWVWGAIRKRTNALAEIEIHRIYLYGSIATAVYTNLVVYTHLTLMNAKHHAMQRTYPLTAQLMHHRP